MISVRDLWKVYGPRAERIVGSPEADLPRGELQAKLGFLLGAFAGQIEAEIKRQLDDALAKEQAKKKK